MKTIILILVVAVAVLGSEWSFASVNNSERVTALLTMDKLEKEVSVKQDVDLLSYIILTGGTRRRVYEYVLPKGNEQLAYIVFTGGTRRRVYEYVLPKGNEQLAYIVWGGGTRRRVYEYVLPIGH